jgi:hypothetical protein
MSVRRRATGSASGRTQPAIWASAARSRPPTAERVARQAAQGQVEASLGQPVQVDRRERLAHCLRPPLEQGTTRLSNRAAKPRPRGRRTVIVPTLRFRRRGFPKPLRYPLGGRSPPVARSAPRPAAPPPPPPRGAAATGPTSHGERRPPTVPRPPTSGPALTRSIDLRSGSCRTKRYTASPISTPLEVTSDRARNITNAEGESSPPVARLWL